MAYPTAIGCGCLLGAGGASHLHAAEWAMQPLLSWEVDYDTNRALLPTDPAGEQTVLTADVQLTRALEDMQLMLEPHVDLRRFSDSRWGPGDDRSLASAFSWSGERAQLNLKASIANQNTLTTELLETGFIDTNTRRQLATGSLELDTFRTEEHLFFMQVSYLGSKYSGPADIELLLPGYRYESGAVGERFISSEHWTLSASAFGDILHSDRAGGSSHEAGGQIEISYTRSERYNFDLQIGESRRVLSQEVGIDNAGNPIFGGTASLGTNASATATRNFELGSLSFNYNRSLVPYGNGFLVQRQSVSAIARRSLTPVLDADLTLTRIQNNDSTVRLRLDRRFYDNVAAGLNWRLSESWTLRGDGATSWAPPIGSLHTVHEWHAGLTMTWKPNPLVTSR
jgi:hypothetical protein